MYSTSSKRGANAGQSARAVVARAGDSQPRKVMPIDDSAAELRGRRSQLLLKACCCCFACVESRSRNKSRSLCFWSRSTHPGALEVRKIPDPGYFKLRVTLGSIQRDRGMPKAWFDPTLSRLPGRPIPTPHAQPVLGQAVRLGL